MARSKRGVTYIEVIVAVAVLLVWFGMILPNVTAYKRTANDQAFAFRFRALFGRATQLAITSGLPCSIRYDSSAQNFVLEQATDTATTSTTLTNTGESAYSNGSGAGTSTISSVRSGAPASTDVTQIDTVPTVADAAFDQYSMAGSDVDGSQWEAHFYPDGSGNENGIHYKLAGVDESVYMNVNGVISYPDTLPQQGDNRWEAGTYAQRTTTTTNG